METNKLKLTAGILNLGTEVEIYDWLALVAPEYGTRPFNKRFETWLNKKSAERFGTHKVERWGDEIVDYENVRFSFSKQSWGDKFELNFYYPGKSVGYDYDAKKAVMRDSNEREGLVSVASVDEIVDWSKKCSSNRAMEREKARGNLTVLPELMKQQQKIKDLICAFNDDISYLLSDELRIR